MKNAALYRPCVGIMLLSKDGRIFTGKRIDHAGDYWQMPQGGIDDGEDILTAARRELLEETSIASVTLIHQHPEWLYYDLPEPLKNKLWQGRYLGQRQIWCCFGFDGNEREINIATEHPEFCDWRWTALSDLPKCIVPFKKPLYQNLVEIFTPHLKNSQPS